jgi:Tfp pilus assembly protein PilN
MADGTPGERRKNAAMGVTILVSIAIAVVGWTLLSQSWAKDAGHQLILQKVEYSTSLGETSREANVEQDRLINELVKITERLMVLQESMQKQLDRIERKLP